MYQKPLIYHICRLKTSLYSIKDTLILTYHNVDSNLHVGLNFIHPETFHQHIKYIRKCIVSEKYNANVLIKFDDGYESVFLNAFPIMEEYGFKGIVFPVSRYIGNNNNWDIVKGAHHGFINFVYCVRV